MTLCLLVTSFNSSVHLDRFLGWVGTVQELFEEIIVMDDCSDDGSYERICRDSRTFNNFFVHRSTVNSGRPSIPRNQGLKLVTAERVVFLDIDDLIPINYIKFLRNSSNQYCFSGTKLSIDERLYKNDYASDFSKQLEVSSTQIKRKNLITLSGASLPTAVARRYHFPNEPLEDWDYWVSVSTNEPSVKCIKFLDVPIYYDIVVSLSPNKSKQIIRVVKKSGMSNLIYYCIYTVKLKYLEKKLNSKFTKSLL
jgi:glycosyltransferase involved in cell wall biosynthesis